MNINDIINSKWLIQSDIAISFLPDLISYCNGNANAFTDIKKRLDQKNIAYSVCDSGNLVSRHELDDIDIPNDSVAVLPLDGPIYADRSMQFVRYLDMANANPQICAIILAGNSPGGTVFYTDILADAIRNSKKPVVGYVWETGASAFMWIFSACKYRFVSSKLDQLGSIGVMASITDMSRGLKEKLGIDVYDIYASLSTKKNEFSRIIKNPELSVEEKSIPIIKDLDFVNQIFHETIRENLGLKKESEVFSGAMYFAERAIELGLANEINSFEYAVDYARALGLKTKYL